MNTDATDLQIEKSQRSLFLDPFRISVIRVYQWQGFAFPLRSAKQT
jgi:hypothetical protein